MTKIRCSTYRPDDSDSARLQKILGNKRFEALQAAFGGKKVWVPKAGTGAGCQACAKRNLCILAWRDSGVPVATIAARLQLSVKTVYRVIRDRPACPPD